MDYEFGGRKNQSAFLAEEGEDRTAKNSEKGMGKEGEGDGEGSGKILEVRMGAGDEDLGAGWGSLVELRIEVRSRLSLFSSKTIADRASPSHSYRELVLKDSSRTYLVLGNLSRRKQTR